MLSDVLLESLTQRLAEAERSQAPISPLSESYPELSTEDAYRIQNRLVATRGDNPVGYKLGFTSQAMREQMNIASPNYGQLTESMWVDPNAGRVDLSELIHPRVEPEVALLVERDLKGPGLAPVAVYPAVRWAFPALEVVDSRFREYRFRAADNTADNSSAARFVLGRPVPLSGVPDLRLAGVLLWRDGRVIDRGLGADALGDPVRAVVWLADRLGEAGRRLEAGSIVLTGGLTQAYPIGEGGSFVAEFGGLGTVKVHFERSKVATNLE